MWPNTLPQWSKIYNLIDMQKYNKSMKSLLSIETLHKSFSVKAEVIPVW